MKKLLILTAVCAISTAPVSAVQKCVALDSDSLTCTDDFSVLSSTEWWTTCRSPYASDIEVKGIAVCSFSNTSTDVNGTETVLNMSTLGSYTLNTYCWCKIISPVVSKWRFYMQATSAGECYKECAIGCASAFSTNVGLFRDRILYNLSD